MKFSVKFIRNEKLIGETPFEAKDEDDAHAQASKWIEKDSSALAKQCRDNRNQIGMEIDDGENPPLVIRSMIERAKQ